MKIVKIAVVGLCLAVVTIFVSEIGGKLSVPGVQHLVPNVEARVGRPLTPVSVAGVARRTVRRCAVGIYNCGISDPRSLASQREQISSVQSQPVTDIRNKGAQG